ncbi:uncharacterized protein RJT20DRAFT_123987 [Scheffersomyces xylosifermentans]|uniref:uncharacterized protein n=1 Tax=Scheffersomyces xylosifermentans TaxID=1304137 RepID=UPI00315C89F1
MNVNDVLEQKDTIVENAQRKVIECPYKEELHNALIDLLFERDESPTDLIEAIVEKQRNFVLSEQNVTLWKLAIDKIPDGSQKDLELFRFYSLMVEDYPTVLYWEKILSFAIDKVKSGSEIIPAEELPGLFSRALKDTSHSYPDVHLIWNIVLGYLQDEYDQTASESVFQMLNSLHIKRISTPHLKLDDSFSELSAFVSRYKEEEYSQLMSKANGIYSASKKMQRYYEELENLLAQEPDKLRAWSQYLETVAKYVKDVKGLASVSQVFSRAPADSPQWIPFWMTYIYILYDFQRKEIDDESFEWTVNLMISDILEKFIRTFPSSPASYAEYIRNCSEDDEGETKFAHIIRRLSVLNLQENYDEWKKIALAELNFRFKSSGDAGKPLLEVIHRYVTFAIKENNDVFHSVEKLAVSILTELKEFKRADEIVEMLIVYFGSQCDIWLYAISYFRSRNYSVNDITQYFHNAILEAETMDWPERLMEEWLRFEEVYGSAADYKKAVLECNKAIRDIASKVEEEVNVVEDSSQHEAAHPEETPSKKRKLDDSFSISKIQPSRSREKFSVKVSNIGNANDAEIVQLFKECGEIRDIILSTEGRNSIATIEFSNEQEVLSALTKDKKKFHDSTIEVQRLEKCIVFVNNYPPSLSQESLKDMFTKIGTVLSVRFPSQKSNHARRFCYVEYSNPDSAKQAIIVYDGKVLTDELSGKEYTIKVAISNTEERTFQERDRPALNVRVKNLPFKADKNEIIEFFMKCGEISNVIIPQFTPSFADQKNSGLAYINFAGAEGAQRALKLDDKLFHDRHIAVTYGHTNSKTRVQKFNDMLTIGVSNVDNSLTTDQIKAFFNENVGVVTMVETFPEHNAALVEFEKPSDAGNALMASLKLTLASRELKLSSKADILHLVGSTGSHSAAQGTRSKPKVMVPPSLQRRKRK